MHSVQVKIPEGGLQCWVVLSGLEVLAACQKHETGQVDRCSIFTAHLWDYIRAKVWVGVTDSPLHNHCSTMERHLWQCGESNVHALLVIGLASSILAEFWGGGLRKLMLVRRSVV